MQALLGDLKPLRGHIKLPNDLNVGYCTQKPWLLTGTLRSNIIGMSDYDEGWYQEIINACDLAIDIGNLPLGGETDLGTNGAALSGGQRQRVVCTPSLFAFFKSTKSLF